MADIKAVRDRDPACDSFIVCVLYFKGFQALQSYRVAHWMWQNGRKVGLIHCSWMCSMLEHRITVDEHLPMPL